MATKKITQLPEGGALVGTELVQVSQASGGAEVTGTTISAQASDNSFNDSAAGFVAAGFAVGQRVLVSGFTGTLANNLTVGAITALTASKMTIGGPDGDVIADEAAGDSVSISQWISVRSTVLAIANMLDLSAEIAAAIAAAGGNTGGGGSITGIVTGLGTNYVDDLDFEMAAGSFYLDGSLISTGAQTISLAAADPDDPRIDVLYVDENGVFGSITGTPSPAPSQPSYDPTTQLYLTFVQVPAAATTLSTITNVDIYKEGVEWTASTSGLGFTVDSTNNPATGTKCIEGTNVAAGAYVKFTAPAPVSYDGDGNLVLRIRSKGTWSSRRWLTLQWFNGGVAKGAQISLKTGTFGFESAVGGVYQLIVVNKGLFQVPAGSEVDEFRITDVGGAIGFYIDDIVLQSTAGATGGGSTGGISQTDADARYAQRSNNLSDLTDFAAARSNLGVDLHVTPSTITGNYTLVIGDKGAYKRVTAAAVVTVPPNADVAFAIGTVVTFRAATGGTVSLAAGSGVTLNPPGGSGGSLDFAEEGATVQIKKVATNEWDVIGGTAAA